MGRGHIATGRMLVSTNFRFCFLEYVCNTVGICNNEEEEVGELVEGEGGEEGAGEDGGESKIW